MKRRAPPREPAHVLLYHPSFEPLAKRIVSDPTFAGRVHLSQISWEAFADKFPKLRIEEPALLDHSQSVSILINFASPEIIFEQLAVTYALPRMGAPNFRVILPYFSVGTMERAGPHTAHSHTVHLPRGALLTPRTM